MSVAAPDVTARTEVATGGFSGAAPPGVLPSAKGPSEHASARTSAPRRMVARRGLKWDIISILTVTRRCRPPRANARSGGRPGLWFWASHPVKRAPHNACGRRTVLSKSCRPRARRRFLHLRSRGRAGEERGNGAAGAAGRASGFSFALPALRILLALLLFARARGEGLQHFDERVHVGLGARGRRRARARAGARAARGGRRPLRGQRVGDGVLLSQRLRLDGD